MRRTGPHTIALTDLRGGRNDTDSPLSLPLNQATEFLNCDWKDTTFARKRGGATSISLSGGTAFSGNLAFLFRHVPGAAETGAELWGIDNNPALVKRLAGGTSWADVTVDDSFASTAQESAACSLNGKLFLTYDSSVDRLHVYDPGLSSARVRRVGIAQPAAPTVANTGAGAYAAVLRYYRVRFIQLTGARQTRRSEASPSQSFTPSGAGTAARITRPTAPGEGETHWEIEVSSDNATWYLLAGMGVGVAGTDQAIAVASTTYDDTALAAAYVNGDTPAVAGTYTNFPSVKYLITDGNRLLGAHAWEAAGAVSGGRTSRIWFTPVLGSTDKGDDERVPNTSTQKNYVDVNENDGGSITGLGGPLNGVPWYFKYRQVGRLQPTGDVAVPYLPRKMRDDIGCIAHKSIALGQDHRGRPALYFLSHRGPYRITADGDIEYLGRDNEGVWRSVNLGATTIVAHSTYYPDLHQWWLWIATGASNAPDVKMVFDVQLGFEDEHNEIRGGWAKHDGASAGAICSCLFSNTLGASMSRDLKPHIGRSSGTAILKCDTSDTDDALTDFQAYVTTRPLVGPNDAWQKHGAAEPTLIGKALAGSDVSVSAVRDFGKETIGPKSVSLAPAGSETRVLKKVEGLEVGEADATQYTVGDSAANDEVWTIDGLVVPMLPQEAR